jgi:hypothetical protein
MILRRRRSRGANQDGFNTLEFLLRPGCANGLALGWRQRRTLDSRL